MGSTLIANMPAGRINTVGAKNYRQDVSVPVLPNGPLAGTTKVVSVTTTAQDVAIPAGTSLVIIKVMQAPTCGYVGYRFRSPGATSAVALGNDGTFLYSLAPGEYVIEAPVDGATALSIACDASTATAHVFFRT